MNLTPRHLTVPVTVLALTGLLGGCGHGTTGKLAQETALAHSLRAKLSAAQAELATARADLSAERSKLSSAQQAARQATARAEARAAAQYASRERAVRSLERKLRREQGIVAANTISSDGVYVVGQDIKPGTYHTSGGGQCYYALLSSDNTSDIIDNNNFTGPETVDTSGAHAFQIAGGCTWTLISGG
jgi:hypothetical protein